MADVFGQDIALDGDWQARVAADGSLVLTEGPDTGVQDIKLALWVYLGSLFYDTSHGSILRDWCREESTASTRAGLCSEVERTLRTDPRVVVGSESASVMSWDHLGVKLTVSWRFIDTDHPENLVLSLGRDGTIKEVLSDVEA